MEKITLWFSKGESRKQVVITACIIILVAIAVYFLLSSKALAPSLTNSKTDLTASTTAL